MKPRTSYIPCFFLLAAAAVISGDYLYYSSTEVLGVSQQTITGLRQQVEQSPLAQQPIDRQLVRLDSIDGFADNLIVMELWFAIIFAFFLVVGSLRPKNFSVIKEASKTIILARIVVLTAVATLAYAQTVSLGRPITSVGLVMPGSLLTRMLVVDISFWLRRLLEPSLWIFFIVLCFASRWATSLRGRRFYILSALLLVVLIATETLATTPLVRPLVEMPLPSVIVSYLLFGQTQLCIASLLFALRYQSMSVRDLSEFRNSGKTAWKLILGAGTSALVLGVALSLGNSLIATRNAPLVGAYYYSWFPQNWKHGYIGKELDPQVVPLAGEYSSNDKGVFVKHVSWAKEAGINFFIFDWWPNRPWVRKNFDAQLEQSELFVDFNFAIHYETLDLDDSSKSRVNVSDGDVPSAENVLVMTAERAWRLKKHWEHIAKNYMKHPAYLQIDGKPVLFVYTTRHLVGPIAKAVRDARTHVERTTGVKLYLVADEAFFNVMQYSAEHQISMRPELSPNWARLSPFDAITSYNPYDSTRIEHGRTQGVGPFFSDVESTFKRYRAVAHTLNQLFIPGVIPGYNDRAVRLKDNHFVIPRVFGKKGPVSFFAQALQLLVKPFADKHRPVFTVTSWNEWNEGTQIEPTVESACTTRDSSGESGKYTQWELHCGYGFKHLKELKEALNDM